MPSSNISVTLSTHSQYNVFYPFMEMIARENCKEKYGKMICPELIFEVQGLDMEKTYEILLAVERYDNTRYQFVNGKWGDSQLRKFLEGHEYRKISKGVRSGQQWMNGPISFEEARITNVKKCGEKDNTFYVTTMHKYSPVLYIIDVDSPYSEQRFPVDLAQFIPVTVYQNKELGKWKCSQNKYSTAKNGAVVKETVKRKTPNEEEPEVKRAPLKPVNRTFDFQGSFNTSESSLNSTPNQFDFSFQYPTHFPIYSSFFNPNYPTYTFPSTHFNPYVQYAPTNFINFNY